MGMEILEFIYFVCFFLGLGFAILSGLLSGVFSGGADAHVDAGGVHTDGGVQVGPHEGPVHFSPLSPVSIAMFISTFGGTGILLKKMTKLPDLVQVPIAGVAAVAVGTVVAWLFYKILTTTQSSSHAREAEAIGIEAEVTVPIPNGGLGEIAYTVRGTRFTNSARTIDDKELPARVTVKIVKQVGNTYVVQKSQ